MKLKSLFVAICFVLASAVSATADVFELRTYTVNEGKLDALNKRFRDHTVKLFEKHGMVNVGYWVPADAPKSKNTLIYVLKHKSREAAKASWKGFVNDPDWKKAFKESRKDGAIVNKVESVFMKATDYSPTFKSGKAAKDTVFELRIYKTGKGKLANLDSRFRDHTIDLFSRHGMKSVAYWHPTDEPDAADTLIYILEHKSRDASKKSWPAFIQDEEWKKVFAASRKNGGLLRERPESIYMKATDYSAIK